MVWWQVEGEEVQEECQCAEVVKMVGGRGQLLPVRTEAAAHFVCELANTETEVLCSPKCYTHWRKGVVVKKKKKKKKKRRKRRRGRGRGGGGGRRTRRGGGGRRGGRV
ncbi:hypothetical protein INR49_029323, partial [Caranx melampygus]